MQFKTQLSLSYSYGNTYVITETALSLHLSVVRASICPDPIQPTHQPSDPT